MFKTEMRNMLKAYAIISDFEPPVLASVNGMGI